MSLRRNDIIRREFYVQETIEDHSLSVAIEKMNDFDPRIIIKIDMREYNFSIEVAQALYNLLEVGIYQAEELKEYHEDE